MAEALSLIARTALEHHIECNAMPMNEDLRFHEYDDYSCPKCAEEAETGDEVVFFGCHWSPVYLHLECARAHYIIEENPNCLACGGQVAHSHLYAQEG